MRQRITKQQTTHTFTSRRKYWDYVNGNNKSEDGEVREYAQANPDILAEAQAMYSISETQQEAKEQAGQVLKMAEQILSSEHYELFQLIALEDKSLQEAADMMGWTKSMANRRWKEVQARLKRQFKNAK